MSAAPVCPQWRERRRPYRPLLPCLVLGLLLGACAGDRAQRRLEDEAARFVYVAPAPKVMAQARALLEARGYTVREDPTGRPVLSTPWKQVVDSPGAASQVRRYLVAAKDVGQGRLLVRVYSINYTTVGLADAHPSLGSRSGRQSGEGGGRSGPFVAGERVSASKGWLQRDLELEWRLLERLEPELAQLLKEEAQGGAPRSAVASAPAPRR